MFQSLKVVGVCAVLLGIECADAMQIEKQGQSNSLQKVEMGISLPEVESPTRENLLEDIEHEVINPWEDIQNHSEIEKAISENATENPIDTGEVSSNSEEAVQQPENANPIEEIQNPEESAPAESITEPESVNPIEEIQNPEESAPAEVDLGEPITVPEIVNPIDDQISTGSTTEVEETVSPTEDENLIGSSTEVDEATSGIESGSESECVESIHVRIVRILTVIKDKSIGFLRRILNLFF